jgi:hypothetical protein
VDMTAEQKLWRISRANTSCLMYCIFQLWKFTSPIVYFRHRKPTSQLHMPTF